MGRNVKYKTLTLKQKLSAIQEIDNGEVMKKVAEKYGIPANTLSTIRKNKEKLKRLLHNNPLLIERKRMRRGKFAVLDNAVENFVSEARTNNVPLNGNVIKEKAKQFGVALNCEAFKASTGWLDRLKRRTGMKLRCVSGAYKSVAADWINLTLKPLIRNYNENDIFNVDETALFYKHLPGDSYELTSKERITIMLCANMSGNEKMKPLVVGNCYVNAKLVDYEFNKMAWMNSAIFENWLMRLDEEFGRQHRKVLFFFDNCSAHRKDLQLKLINIRVEFFPPNLTTLLQPMELGIIKCFKTHYRLRIIKDLLLSFERNEKAMKISLSDSIKRISEIWDVDVSPAIISNCFRKCGFFYDCIVDDDGVSSIIAETERLFNSLRLIYNFRENFLEFLDCDVNVVCGDIMTDEDIIESAQNSSRSVDDAEGSETNLPSEFVTNEAMEEKFIVNENLEERFVINENSEEKFSFITNSEMRECVQKLRNGMLQRSSVPHTFFNILNEMEVFLDTN